MQSITKGPQTFVNYLLCVYKGRVGTNCVTIQSILYNYSDHTVLSS